jgi:hypothetical protein
MLKQHISTGVFVVYIDTGNPVLYIPLKSRDLAAENNKTLTEWKWFETTVLYLFLNLQYVAFVSIFCPECYY